MHTTDDHNAAHPRVPPAGSGADDDGESSEPDTKRRKIYASWKDENDGEEQTVHKSSENKRAKERERRRHISVSIDDLRRAIPPRFQKDRLNQVATMALAVDYIKHLQQHIFELESALAQTRRYENNPPVAYVLPTDQKVPTIPQNIYPIPQRPTLPPYSHGTYPPPFDEQQYRMNLSAQNFQPPPVDPTFQNYVPRKIEPPIEMCPEPSVPQPSADVFLSSRRGRDLLPQPSEMLNADAKVPAPEAPPAEHHD